MEIAKAMFMWHVGEEKNFKEEMNPYGQQFTDIAMYKKAKELLPDVCSQAGMDMWLRFFNCYLLLTKRSLGADMYMHFGEGNNSIAVYRQSPREEEDNHVQSFMRGKVYCIKNASEKESTVFLHEYLITHTYEPVSTFISKYMVAVVHRMLEEETLYHLKNMIYFRKVMAELLGKVERIE